MINGNSPPTRNIFWHFPAYLEAYGKMNMAWRQTPAGSMRLGKWKLIEFFEDNHLELYNLSEDVGEQYNLADSLPNLCDSILHQLQIWRDEIHAPIPSKLNPLYIPYDE